MCKQIWWIHQDFIMYEKWFYFLLNSSFSGKMVFLRKLKLIYPSTLAQHYNNCLAPTFLILFEKLLAPSLFKKEGRDYAFYMRDYKRETIKLLPLYMADFLLQNCKVITFEENLKNCMKNDIPNIPNHSYFWTKFTIMWTSSHRRQFHHKNSLALWDQFSPTASGAPSFL